MGWGGAPVEIEDITVIKRTSKAALIDSPTTGETWIPMAAIHDDSDVYREDDQGTMLVKMWFAEKKDWV